MASSQGGLAARRVRTLLLAAAKEDRWVRQDLLLRSEDEEWLEECVAEAAKPWYRALSLRLSLSLSLSLSLTLPLTLTCGWSSCAAPARTGRAHGPKRPGRPG